MDAIALHLEVRNALSISDELGRHEHALGNDTFAGQLAALRTSLAEIEKEIGKSHAHAQTPSPVLVDRLSHYANVLREEADQLPDVLRPRLGLLLDALERIVFAAVRPLEAVPSKPVLGVLPLKRVIPQDVHSVGDYLAAALFFASAGVARTARARSVGIALGTQITGVSLLTDYRLSAMKLIPIEAHEVADHVTGASAVALPFALGYASKDRVASFLQVLAGATTIALSLFTDYRAAKGIGARARRSKGGPMQPVRQRPVGGRTRGLLASIFAPKPRVRVRVQEEQRPLEGLSAPSHLSTLEL